MQNKTPADCVQLYYFWKKLSVDYKVTTINSDTEHIGGSLVQAQSHVEVRPHVCEMPDCSAVRHLIVEYSKYNFYFFYRALLQKRLCTVIFEFIVSDGMSIIRLTADLFSQVLRMVLLQRMIIPARCAASKITPLYITNRLHVHLLIFHQPNHATFHIIIKTFGLVLLI